MDIDVHVVAIGQSDVGGDPAVGDAGTGNGCGARLRQEHIGMFTLADGDAAGHGALVVHDAVVGDLDIVAPGVNPDAAAALRAVLNGQAINAGRVAVEVTGERIAVANAVGSAAVS